MEKLYDHDSVMILTEGKEKKYFLEPIYLYQTDAIELNSKKKVWKYISVGKKVIFKLASSSCSHSLLT